ncbi:hypothetical protein LCGC14_0641600 [marine sediment metagenome]|uniref:Uncharacterized protein n=1 Tax=marine sediment metagenome TaxID=412755 RepID=A0A0F9QZ24_9ZZZZ
MFDEEKKEGETPETPEEGKKEGEQTEGGGEEESSKE